MAHDSHRGRTVLFGGSSAVDPWKGDTWEWNGSAWSQASSNGPVGRAEPAMAFDSARGRVVMFGGSSSQGALGDTWEWDGATWTAMSSAVNPNARAASAMAFDSARGRCVLFGGAPTATSPLADTWEWDGAAWTAMAASGPGPRNSHVMAFDSGRARTVLFGGENTYQQPSAIFGDTWEWNGVSWSLVTTSGPGLRSRIAMAYDSQRAVVVVHGGTTGRSQLGDTWSWNGSTWALIAVAATPQRAMHSMAFNAQQRGILMFGGMTPTGTSPSDTWYFAAPSTPAFTTFGQGCPGPAGILQLAAAPGSLPILGQTFTMQLTNLPVSIFAVPFGAVGFSNQTFGGAALPAALDVLGAPGCTLFVSIDQEFVLANVSGTATWNLPVPNDLGLLGLEAYVQGAVLVPGFNPANLVVSNAGHAVVGTP